MFCLPFCSRPRVRRGKLVRATPYPHYTRGVKLHRTQSVHPNARRSRPRTKLFAGPPYSSLGAPDMKRPKGPGLRRQVVLLWKKVRDGPISTLRAQEPPSRFSFIPPGFVKIDIPQKRRSSYTSSFGFNFRSNPHDLSSSTFNEKDYSFN